MLITNFHGNQRNAENGIVRELSFEELSTQFSVPIKGNKHIGYFVRGKLEPPERKDVNLASADLLVIDGDRTSTDESSCCPPIDVNIALTEMGINHFIYTTHSHSFEKNKFRVVIPCKISCKENLKPTVKKILAELKKHDVDIAYVKEMGVWSQPWFIPSRDDPADNYFEHYEYLEGKDYEEVKAKARDNQLQGNKINISSSNSGSNTNDSNNNATGSDSESISTIITTITNGSTGLHDAINKYSYMQIKDGIAPKVVIETLRGLMTACPKRDERWQDRYDDIERSVQGAIDRIKVEKVELNKVDVGDIKDDGMEARTEMPWPPGLLGELAEDAYNMQIYQYKEVAIVSAIGLIAGIAGRKFNVSNTGLNVYLTLIMDTGMGKDSIVKFISSVLMNVMEDGDTTIQPSFLGKSKFTGSKAIVNRMKNALSQISVFTEAGLLLKTKSGDQSGLLRALLDLYTKSGENDVFIGAEYSDEDKSVPNLRAPALSIINESTADILQEAFRENNSIDSGHLPRQSIYRVIGDKPYRNWTGGGFHVRDECIKKLRNLVMKCGKVQAQAHPKAWHFTFAEGIRQRAMKLEEYFTDEYNKNRTVNNTRANMASRMPLKALKFAAIASVFNHHDLEIRETEWEWAEAMVHYEYNGVDNFFMSTGTGEMYDLIRYIVGPVIVKMLKGEYKSRKTGLSSRDRKMGLIPLSVLSFNLKNNSHVKKLDDDTKNRTNPKTGIQKCVDYMYGHDFLRKVDDPYSNRTRVYMVTESFKAMMVDYE